MFAQIFQEENWVTGIYTLQKNERSAYLMRLKVRYLLAGVLVGAILICPAMATTSFPDIDEYAPYAEAVEYLKERSIMVGDSNGNFNPNQTVTRAEMATIVCRMLGETENLVISNTFTDVSDTHWANKYIAKAAELSIISGYGNRKFGPNDMVTYEQAVTMVVRALGGAELAADAGGYPNGFMAVAQTYGFVNDVQAEMGEPLSRADIAIILFNCYGFDFYD